MSFIDTTTVDTLTAIGVRVSPIKAVGTPIPYSAGHDDSIGILLIVCFLAGVIAVSFSRNALLRQVKHFFYVPKNIAAIMMTLAEKRAQYVLILLSAVCIAIVSFLHYQENTQVAIVPPASLLQIGFYTLITVSSFLLRYVLYNCVNWIFFEKQKSEQWMKAWLFLSASEGLLIFPAIVLHIYSTLPLRQLVIFSLFIVGITKLLAFYKCKTIFFKGFGGFLQIILYLCTLEIVPLVILCGTLIKTSINIDLYF